MLLFVRLYNHLEKQTLFHLYLLFLCINLSRYDKYSKFHKYWSYFIVSSEGYTICKHFTHNDFDLCIELSLDIQLYYFDTVLCFYFLRAKELSLHQIYFLKLVILIYLIDTVAISGLLNIFCIILIW